MDTSSLMIVATVCAVIATLLFVINTVIVFVLGIFLVRHVTYVAGEIAELSRTIFRVTDVLDERANTPIPRR